MAVIYCRSTDGSDSDNGSTWALAKATLAAALTAAGAGGTVYVSQVHAESQGTAITLASPGTAASPCLVLCGNDGAAPPTALATTATVSTTGANTIGFTGFTYCYGITFSAGDSSNAANLTFNIATAIAWILDSCLLKLNNTSTSSRINLGASAGVVQLVELRNTPCQFGSTSQTINTFGKVIWRNTPSAIVGTVPTILLTPSGARGGFLDLIGVDLSAAGSGKSLVNTAAIIGPVTIRDCKLGASVALTNGADSGQGSPNIILINCDSGDTNYRYQKHNYMGDIYSESTIVRSSGASDGTTPISRKMVSTANSKFYAPLESDPVLYWNETTGSSITATIEIVTDNVTLTDAEAWIEIDYLGTSGFPLSLLASDRATNILTTPANQTSSSVTWTTTGLSTPLKQKLSISFTPQEKGLIRARVMLAKASTTLYFDPLLVIS